MGCGSAQTHSIILKYAHERMLFVSLFQCKKQFFTIVDIKRVVQSLLCTTISNNSVSFANISNRL